MNNDNLKGTANKVAGSIESSYGSFTGDRSEELSGNTKKLTGEAQQLLGDAKAKVYDITDRVNHEIHESPVRSSFIALGVGFLLGALLAR